ncbi:RHS domain-containing protein, partial [Phytobacter massiliensis]|uniref:RHS domain-containing protein n=1 Tax=Phytobacter massiliensis TaxID=1485952 RepID=UPI0005C5427C
PHRATVKGDRLLIQGDHHFEYDEFGNLTAERWGKQQCRARLYEWDCEHRLVRLTQVRRQDGGETQKESWRYRYDAFGRRWRKEDEQTGKATLFFWQDERMVTECDEDDALFDPREVDNEYVKATAFACTSYLYEPGSFRPLAQFKGRGRGGAVYWYINDHLGTPQELVDGKGNIAWSGLYRSYGQLVVQGGAVRQPL